MEEEAFFLEIQRLSLEIDAVVDKYDMRDRVASVIVTGIMDEDFFGNVRLKAIYSYSLDSRSELENIMDFIDSTWSADSEPQDLPEERGYNGIDDLLDGTGIELE